MPYEAFVLDVRRGTSGVPIRFPGGPLGPKRERESEAGRGPPSARIWALRANHTATVMINLEDCIALSGLTEAQVLAIAEHEHVPEIAATALAQYLSNQEHGMQKIRDMIVDDIRQAQQRGDKAHVLTLLHVLHHFLKSHPEVCPAQHPWSKA